MASQEKEGFRTDVLVLAAGPALPRKSIVHADLPIHLPSAPTHSGVQGVNCIGYAAVKQAAQPEDKALLADIPSTDMGTRSPTNMYVGA